MINANAERSALALTKRTASNYVQYCIDCQAFHFCAPFPFSVSERIMINDMPCVRYVKLLRINSSQGFLQWSGTVCIGIQFPSHAHQDRTQGATCDHFRLAPVIIGGVCPQSHSSGWTIGWSSDRSQGLLEIPYPRKSGRNARLPVSLVITAEAFTLKFASGYRDN